MKRLKRWSYIVCALAVAACAQERINSAPGQYKDFADALHQGIIDDANKGGWEGVPIGVERKWADCATTFTVSEIDAETLDRLNSVAQGRSSMPLDEYRDAYQPAMDTIRSDPSFSYLEPFCPDDIAAFQKYLPLVKRGSI